MHRFHEKHLNKTLLNERIRTFMKTCLDVFMRHAPVSNVHQTCYNNMVYTV